MMRAAVLTLPPDEMLQRAWAALDEGKLGFAEHAARAVLSVRPKDGSAWLALSRSLMQQGKLDVSEPALASAEANGARPLDVLHTRSNLLWLLGRDEEALAATTKVLAERPRSVDALLQAAGCLRRLGDLAGARRVLTELPNHPEAASIAAWSWLDEGQPKEAIALLEPVAKRADLSPLHRARVCHPLGVAYEALGRYDDALRSYLASRAALPGRFDPDGFRRSVELMRSIFSREFLAKAPRASVRSSRPVFIAAMPRSGTTLLDRIIAAHPRGAGAGETRALRGQIAEWDGPDPNKAFPRVVPSLTAADLDRIATRYLRETDPFGASAERTADKHLQNWVYVGLIAMAFPDARVIHLRRDPLDVGISCLERLLGHAVGWSSDLTHIGVALRGAERLMEHWKEVAPIPILTVDYESLVRRQREETARILEFLGLPWDDACMAFHREHKPLAERPAPTLATEQTRRPMNDRSIGRGARFGKGLDPLRAALAEPTN